MSRCFEWILTFSVALKGRNFLELTTLQSNLVRSKILMQYFPQSLLRNYFWNNAKKFHKNFYFTHIQSKYKRIFFSFTAHRITYPVIKAHFNLRSFYLRNKSIVHIYTLKDRMYKYLIDYKLG